MEASNPLCKAICLRTTLEGISQSHRVLYVPPLLQVILHTEHIINICMRNGLEML